MTTDCARAAGLLRAGGLVAFPTETVYGLGADALNEPAVSRIFAVKGRPASHPLIVHIGRAEDLDAWAIDIPPEARLLARRFWPGPLTLILRRRPRVPDAVTGGLDTVGLRVPAHPLALRLLAAFGGGIAAPSANRFGRVSPTEPAHVAEELGESVDLILDGGRCAVGIESTIIDLSGESPAILRPGGITPEMASEALERDIPVIRGGPVRSPGQHPAHYAPRARVHLVEEGDLRSTVERMLAAGLRVAAMSAAAGDHLPAGAIHLPLPAALPEMAERLYATLRSADAEEVDVVVAAPPPGAGLGLAIRDRLRRAAGPGSRGEDIPR